MKSVADVIHVSKLVTVYYYKYGKSFHFDGESHDFWELYYVDKGDVLVGLDNQEFTLHQGQAVLLAPNTFHKMATGPQTMANVFIISFECKSKPMDVLENKVVTLPDSLSGYTTSIMSECIRSLHPAAYNPLFFYPIQEKEDQAFGGLQIIRNYLELVLITLIRGSDNTVFASSSSTLNE